MIRQLQTFWVAQTSAELVNLLAVFLLGFLRRLQTRCRYVVIFIEREILHIHCVMLLAAT